jgi:guanyl-specific ribonuclease Sa
MVFGEIEEMNHSESQILNIQAANLAAAVQIEASPNFEVSLDDTDFTSELSISNFESLNLYVRFSPQSAALGLIYGTVRVKSTETTDRVVSLSGIGFSTAPSITTSPSSITFQDDIAVGTTSISEQIIVTGQNLTDVININITGPFKVSLDGFEYSNSLQILSESANGSTDVYIRFTPEVIGSNSGIMTLQSTAATDLEVNLLGTGAPNVHNYTTFNQQALGFGGGFSQSNSQVFNLHQDISNVAQIKMFLQIDCPSTGCDDWDRFANIKVKDDATDNWFEIARYITPYWVGTQQLDRGLEFDVTDFKALLSGPTELRIYIENWTAKADLITLKFDYIEGIPDYPYYAVSEVLGFHANSIDGVPYGVSHSEDLDKTIQIPNNAESTHLRTLISGWGHATPNDNGPDYLRGCAEWCYRTHDLKINGVNSFQHYMGPIGCASNPVSNQSTGNWMPDRAGWCPGMAVPVRSNDLDTSFNGTSFTFEYDFEDWTSDGQGGNAYYATSTYVVVKSNTEISSPVVN